MNGNEKKTKKSIPVKEHRWELLPKIKLGLEDLVKKNPECMELSELSKKLEKIIELREKSIDQEKELKLQKIIGLKERNAYLDKLIQIDKLGNENNWIDSDDILSEIFKILASKEE